MCGLSGIGALFSKEKIIITGNPIREKLTKIKIGSRLNYSLDSILK